MLFATPDFGASANASCCLLFVWALVLGCASWSVVRGIKLFSQESPRPKKIGAVLILLGISLPLCLYHLPAQIVRMHYGNAPLQRYPHEIHTGMTKDEVRAAIGTPHHQFDDGDRERWYYWLDSYGLSYVAVWFGSDGRVTIISGD
jgi:hypothetical protein